MEFNPPSVLQCACTILTLSFKRRHLTARDPDPKALLLGRTPLFAAGAASAADWVAGKPEAALSETISAGVPVCKSLDPGPPCEIPPPEHRGTTPLAHKARHTLHHV